MSAAMLSPVGGAAAWRGSDIDLRAGDGVRLLSAAEVDEIDAALHHLHSLGEVDFPEISPQTRTR